MFTLPNYLLIIMIILVVDIVDTNNQTCPPTIHIQRENTEIYKARCYGKSVYRQVMVATTIHTYFNCGFLWTKVCSKEKTIYKVIKQSYRVTNEYDGLRCLKDCVLHDGSKCVCYCPDVTFGSILNFGVYNTGNITEINKTIHIPCKYGGGQVTGHCIMKDQKPQWTTFNFSACSRQRCPPKDLGINSLYTKKINKTCSVETKFSSMKQFDLVTRQWCGNTNQSKCYSKRRVFKAFTNSIEKNITYLSRECLDDCELIYQECICFCPHIEFGNRDLYGIYKTGKNGTTFKQVNETIRIPCKYGGGVVIGRCIMRNQKPQWTTFDFSQCSVNSMVELRNLTRVNISDENIEEIAVKLTRIVSSNAKNSSIGIKTQKAVAKLVTVTERVLETSNTNTRVNQEVLMVIDAAVGLNKTLITNTTSQRKLYTFMEKIVNGTFNTNVTSLKYTGKNIAMETTSSSQATDLFIQFGKTDEGHLDIGFGNSTMQTNIKAVIILPKEIFHNAQKKPKSIYSFAFDNDLMFVNNGPISYNLSSLIIAASLYNMSVANLKKPVFMEFEVFDGFNESGLQCVYWKFNNKGVFVKDSIGEWANDGCTTHGFITRNEKRIIKCTCDHLTNFAVIFTFKGQRNWSEKNDFELTIISYIGLTISMVALTLTIFTLAFFKKLHQKTSQLITLNLSIALLMLIVTFLTATQKFHSLTNCSVVAYLMQFSLLATFTWTGANGIYLFKKAVLATKNRGNNPLFFKIALILSWGLPLTITLITALSLKPEKLRNSCILAGEKFLYITITPIAIIMILNIVLFGPVIKSIFNHLSVKDKMLNSKKIKKRAFTTISCSLILGLTWSFGFFMAIDVSRLLFEWLFCIFNGLQGFFIFIFYVAKNKESRNEWMKLINRISTCWRRNRKSQTTSKVLTSTNSDIQMTDQANSTETQQQHKKIVYSFENKLALIDP